MEAETKVIEKQYIHDNRHEGCYDDCYYRRHGIDNGARTLGIIGTVAGGLSLLGNGGLNRLFGNNAPAEVVATGNGTCAPTAFQAWEKQCEGALALTNEIWGLKVNTMQQMYDHREVDVNEKFQLYKSQVDADFGLYKSTQESIYALEKQHNADVFALYKGNRDTKDELANRIAALEKEVAVNTAIRPYQDKLIQCEIDRAYTAAVNYTDRRTCRMISGEVVLPNTPTVTGFGSYNPCACPQQSAS